MSSRHLVQEPPLAPSTAPTVDFAKRAGEVAGPVLHGSIDLSHRGGVPYFDAGILEGSRVGLHAAGSLSACLKSDGYPPPGWMIWQPRPRKKKTGVCQRHLSSGWGDHPEIRRGIYGGNIRVHPIGWSRAHPGRRVTSPPPVSYGSARFQCRSYQSHLQLRDGFRNIAVSAFASLGSHGKNLQNAERDFHRWFVLTDTTDW
jgi:hypothetical protein